MIIGWKMLVLGFNCWVAETKIPEVTFVDRTYPSSYYDESRAKERFEKAINYAGKLGCEKVTGSFKELYEGSE